VKVPSAAIFVGQPLRDLRGGVGGQVVQDDVDAQAARDAGVDLFEESQDDFCSVTLELLPSDATGNILDVSLG